MVHCNDGIVVATGRIKKRVGRERSFHLYGKSSRTFNSRNNFSLFFSAEESLFSAMGIQSKNSDPWKGDPEMSLHPPICYLNGAKEHALR